jgi:hypothetical protein
LLKKESDRRGAYYQLPEAELIVPSTPSLFESTSVSESSRHVDKGLKQVRENLREEAELLRQIRKTFREKLSRTRRRQLIVDYILRACSLRPLSAAELAKMFRMSSANIVTAYLNELLRTAKLEWTGRSRNDRSGKYRRARMS